MLNRPHQTALGRDFFERVNHQVPGGYHVDAGCEVEVPNPGVTASFVLSSTGDSRRFVATPTSPSKEYPGREPTWTRAGDFLRCPEPSAFGRVEFYCGDVMIGAARVAP